MTISARKERQRREREEHILDVAYRMLLDAGYLGLHLDRLAEEVEYSKGTLYQHFDTKEDLILAVAARNMERRAALFARAVTLRGRSRERAVAIALADRVLTGLYPGHFQIEQMVRTRSLWEKTSEVRRRQLGAAECRCLDGVTGVVREAHTTGDLTPLGNLAEQTAFQIWSMAYGTNLLADTSAWVRKMGGGLVINPGPAQSAFLDRLGWRPLSSEWNYHDTERRVWEELFAEERKQLPKKPGRL